MAMSAQKCYGVTYGFKKVVNGQSQFQGAFHMNIIAADEQGIFGVLSSLVTVPPGWTLEIENWKAVMSNVWAN